MGLGGGVYGGSFCVVLVVVVFCVLLLLLWLLLFVSHTYRVLSWHINWLTMTIWQAGAVR